MTLRDTAPNPATRLAHDDSGGDGRLVVLLPGAGDIRSEHRFLAPHLEEAGYRVITADLPGHGETPVAADYGIEETAAALLDLVTALDSGPAAVVGVSFAPAAAVWAATEHPEHISAVVAISPHFASDESPKGRILGGLIWALLRGPWAPPVWARLYRSWYKSNPPPDLDTEIGRLRSMLADPQRRRAARKTLLAHRAGVAERMERLTVPSMVVFGGVDDHFDDPLGEATHVSGRLGAEMLMVEGAGHYPHVESPALVGAAVAAFLDKVGR